MDVKKGNEKRAKTALSELCQAYWYPLYCYARGKGLSPQDAEDRAQMFFTNFLNDGFLDSVTPERGRLRAYFKTVLKNLNASHWRHDNRQKRGGGQVHISIDREWAENSLATSPDGDPLENFDRQWAMTLLKNVFNRLEAHYEKTGKSELYESIKDCLQGDGSYGAGESIAQQLGISHDTVRSSVFKLRKRFREYVQEEIAETCSSDEEFKAETAYLCRILSER